MPPLSDDPCKQDGAPNLRSSGLPSEFKAISPKAPPPENTPKPPCSKCKNKCSLKGMKYVQPEVPTSFKPEGRYKPPSFPIESGTIYRLSYPGVDGEMMKDCRAKGLHVSDNIQLCTQPFSQDTTFRLSYTGVTGERPPSFKPQYRNMMGSGPMQTITTHRHDFVPKVTERSLPLKANNNIYLSDAKMENATTMMLSYQPVEGGERPASFKPQSVYKKSDYKFEQDTINKLSYQPWEPMPKEEMPWKKREPYKPPMYTMENNTIYRASYLPVEGCGRLPSFKPASSVTTPNRPFASETIYKESYQDNGIVPRPERIVRKENIYLSTQPMSQDTTARLSYTGVVGERPVSFKPVYRNMMGSGPMQSITTQRHDYIPKQITPVQSFKPSAVVPVSNYKMEDMTTFRASYLPNEGMQRTESYKPSNAYVKSPYPLESETVNRLSYQPNPPMPKEEYPWMKKARYQQPTRCMDGTSIYRGSYLAPGNYVSESGEIVTEEECECQRQQTSATDDL